MTTPISNKSFRDITINCNIIPASLSSRRNIMFVCVIVRIRDCWFKIIIENFRTLGVKT
jgi:hypothetical protein